MAPGWVYGLRKEELQRYGKEFGIDLAGNVDEMRRQFGAWVKEQDQDTTHAERLGELARIHERAPSPLREPKPHTGATLQVPQMAEPAAGSSRLRQHSPSGGRPAATKDYARVAKQVRKWGIKFDGTGKPLEFLEQVEWSANTYGLSLDVIPRAMPELLSGLALKWFIANNEPWTAWQDFRASFQVYFLPRDYFE
ncbi:hypothetical protein KR018_009513, partial [Drosophila ironensis]